MTAVEWTLVAVVHVGVLVTVGYAVDYFTGSAWRDHETGRPLLSKAASLAALFTIAVVGYWWPFLGYEYLYVATVTAVVLSVAYQWRVMRRLRRNPASHF